MLQTSFFKINELKFNELAPHFEKVFIANEKANDKQQKVASLKMLALLYQLKEYTTDFNHLEESFSTPRQILFKKFIQLVNHFYIDKKSVEEYAELLFVTPNHLSQSVKAVSGKDALAFINDRITIEVKSLIKYTNFGIAEIAFQLNFSDPANFGKFFKKHASSTPLEYRKL